MIGLGTVDTFVDISNVAKDEIRRQLKLHNNQNAGVRIQVVIDRYSGYVFDLEFDMPNEEDYKAQIDDIPFFTHKSFLDYIKGMKIDYDQTIPAFVFKNENPTYNCVPGAKFECPSCNLYEERKDDPAYISSV
ncbi:MAG: iron-sulfur cluster biosynthesis family protein [Candidatus Kariarchaeaceae archaeon]|jgi:Fe-S cluster assembly iron-binding protein IscA